MSAVRHRTLSRADVRRHDIGRWLSLAALITLAAMQAHSVPAIAQSVGSCTRAFGDYVQHRDGQLQRMEAEPTLLGLGNTWCTSSLARIAELRSRLEGVRLVCAQVAGDERTRIDRLIVRAALQLDSVKFCAAQVVVADAEPDVAWQTSVRSGPKAPKPAVEKPGPEKRAPIDNPPVAEASKAEKPDASKSQAPIPAAAEPAPFKTTISERAPQPEAAKAPVATSAAKAPKPTAAPKPQEPLPIAAASAGSKKAAHSVGAQMVTATSAAQTKDVVAANEGFDALKHYAVQAEAQPQVAAEEEDCLTITKTSAASYLIENKNCRPQVVLAAIELSRPGQTMRCFTKKVADGIAIAGEGGSPAINFQCREGTKGCAEGMLRGMFPECQPG